MLRTPKEAVPPFARSSLLIACVAACAIFLSLTVIGPALSASSQRQPHDGEDDWQFEEEYAKTHKGKTPIGGMPPGGGSARRLPASAPPASPATRAGNLGFSTGGAKDIGNFRENIAKGFLPLPADVTYEGLFYDYYFETGGNCSGKALFCPTYTTAVSDEPFTGKTEYYLSVGLSSGIESASFSRKKLNLMLVLDISGSMSAPFDKYYYDRFGKKSEQETQDGEGGKSKLAAAAEALTALLDHLKPDDRFGLVLFDQYAYTALCPRRVAQRNMEAIKGHIRELRPIGSTNLDAGLSLATELLSETREHAPDQYENRVIFMTDAMPNMGDTSDKAFLARIQDNAKDRIYATIIGIGVDFNTSLVDKITKARGANSYSVHSPAEFRKRLDAEFDYMVTPLVFDLKLAFQSPGFAIDAVYGSPEADAATGELMRVNTLFPSPTDEEGSRGGLILLRLKKTASDPAILLTATYEDRRGHREHVTEKLEFRTSGGEHYDTPSIRKGILLARYATLLREWLTTARDTSAPPAEKKAGAKKPAADQPELGEWERQSRELQVSPAQRATFARFRDAFQKEMAPCRDESLKRELVVLDHLARGQP